MVRHVFIVITSKNVLHYILLLPGAGLAHLAKCCEHCNETSSLINFQKFISREQLWSEELDFLWASGVSVIAGVGDFSHPDHLKRGLS